MGSEGTEASGSNFEYSMGHVVVANVSKTVLLNVALLT
jgi:hypothetical protein